MLSLVQIERMAADLLEVYQAIENDILLNVASRFSALEGPSISGMLMWQIEKLNQLGALNGENLRVIAKHAGKTEKEIAKLVTGAGFKAIEYDESIYAKALKKGLLKSAAGPARASADIQQILSAAISNAKQTLNLVNTTAVQSANKAFTDIVNKVYLETTLGVRTYTEAIRSSVRDLADKGITGITYNRGGKTINYQVDTAVRRAVLTSTSQTTGKIQLQRAQEWGCDLVEVSSHIGARESHAVWQGKVFCLNGSRDGYGDFYKETGYGTAMGLKGINCAHDFYPFIEGISEQTFKPYDLEENKRVADEQAEQRALEREIRKEKRRIIAADAIGDEEGKLAAQLKLKEKEARMANFLEQTGRTQRKDRQQVVGFGRSEASQATWANKGIANRANRLYNLGSEQANIKAFMRDMPVRDKLLSSDQPKNIVLGKQEKHIIGANNYIKGNSYLAISIDQAQQLVNRYAGSGELLRGLSGTWSNKELIGQHDDIVGVVYDVNGNTQETSKFIIHYAKNGVHIVPTLRKVRTK